VSGSRIEVRSTSFQSSGENILKDMAIGDTSWIGIGSAFKELQFLGLLKTHMHCEKFAVL
jgi:hypothetical protein